MAGKLANQVAIVVGAGQAPGAAVGNGRAVAVTYAREGAKVFVVDRDLDSAKETATLITNDGGDAQAFAADVTDESSVVAMVAACKQLWGRVDILHNNVGISHMGGDGPVTEITEEAWDFLMNVNLKSVLFACKHVLPIMREQSSGKIINIASMAALTANPLAGYKTSKTGVIALTENIAAANAEFGIRVNVILPGIIDTPMAVESRASKLGKSREEVVAMRQLRVPLANRVGTAWDVANAALFLVSDDAGYITGMSMIVDGGLNLVRG
ncbi:3-oxoacyl-ACP reductase [Pseudarthrobacter sulfonivorans]|uniref:3-oxoacyl-ACP reductase n=1 Tax=Pseudarthrobacter sulfonivorans TaxID=121292 RepID=A0A0U3QI04_9MICC|nr:SDR family NAD(P)-dependent oxidoreductase [Pseudarthrobacter sulfonivorans]ALV39924.1 3-oxoacyl-ACP reductase [Pseudarthrobacter sulfonivorans]